MSDLVENSEVHTHFLRLSGAHRLSPPLQEYPVRMPGTAVVGLELGIPRKTGLGAGHSRERGIYRIILLHYNNG